MDEPALAVHAGAGERRRVRPLARVAPRMGKAAGPDVGGSEVDVARDRARGAVLWGAVREWIEGIDPWSIGSAGPRWNGTLGAGRHEGRAARRRDMRRRREALGGVLGAVRGRVLPLALDLAAVPVEVGDAVDRAEEDQALIEVGDVIAIAAGLYGARLEENQAVDRRPRLLLGLAVVVDVARRREWAVCQHAPWFEQFHVECSTPIAKIVANARGLSSLHTRLHQEGATLFDRRPLDADFDRARRPV